MSSQNTQFHSLPSSQRWPGDAVLGSNDRQKSRGWILLGDSSLWSLSLLCTLQAEALTDSSRVSSQGCLHSIQPGKIEMLSLQSKGEACLEPWKIGMVFHSRAKGRPAYCQLCKIWGTWVQGSSPVRQPTECTDIPVGLSVPPLWDLRVRRTTANRAACCVLSNSAGCLWPRSLMTSASNHETMAG